MRAQAVVVAVLAVALAVVTAWMVQGTVPHNLYSLYRVYSVTHIPSQCRHHRSRHQMDTCSYWCLGKAVAAAAAALVAVWAP